MLILGVYIFLMMLMVGGIGIDLMRVERDRAKLQYTLDRAVLAAASLDQEIEPGAVVQDYFNKAELGEYLGGVSVTDSVGARTVSATASADVATQFMHMTGLNSIRTPAASAAEERIQSLEISMVLDISGSMAENSRLSNMQTAAKTFIDHMLTQARNDSVSFSIIPYASQVNVGETLLDEFHDNGFTVSAEHRYSHCVNFIEDQFSRTTIDASQPLERTAHFDPYTHSTMPIQVPVCPIRAGSAIVPITNDRTKLHAAIDAMTALGPTSIDVGVKWGITLLDPSIRPVVSDLAAKGIVPSVYASKPVDYTDENTLKVLIVMSDGKNEDQYFINPTMREGPSNVWYNAEADVYSVYHDQSATKYWIPHLDAWSEYPFGNAPDGSEPGTAVELTFPELNNRASLKYNAEENYSFTSSAWATWISSAFSKREKAAKDQFTKHICDAAKDRDVIVFTIGMEAPITGIKTLKDCASSASHYFNSDGSDILAAFDSIATSIRKLRLTQ
ncbi:pilus assembly protein TadG-related protein [Sedimentitalea sp. JM2-8]|uniref:Pilus assembly protein TadG-related protein n=1 Tax=Sedimentitalea xiamensis TaxID=3050037 RepID=A0ABT7FL64_9RHOB|nr:pilus assembly protein TadG-related protein [Sedimentitalea xiamensis]MDK3075464.1 pilus assembly protein TadG-related protein [Sedimentitalea xiamensis]